MNLLAIDSSSNACSVALGSGGCVLEKHSVEPRAHTAILMPMIASLLAEAGIGMPGLDAIVLGNGPGSFIGMRIGASVAQGICYAAGLPLIPISSLAVVAAEVFAENDADDVIVVQDARMHEVYAGSFYRNEQGLPLASVPECILPIGPLPMCASPIVAAGGAWQKYPALLSANREAIYAVLPFELPRARYLLGLATSVGHAIQPELLEPAYLRTKVAEVPAQNP